MPSPFPGMDPFLEHPDLWPTWQQYFCTHIADTLRDVLPRRYQVRVRERIYADEDAAIFPPTPEVNGNGVCQRPAIVYNSRFTDRLSGAGVWHIATQPETVRESYVELSTAGTESRVVAVLELLSPANKTAEHCGRQAYRRHQRQILAGDIHLLELDLLRAGLPTVAAPHSRLVRRGRFDYLASLCRAAHRDFCEVRPIHLRDSLPQVLVPLGDGDSDVEVDLQTVFAHCYDAGGFGRRIDYNSDPFYPLSHTDAVWAESLLAQSPRRA